MFITKNNISVFTKVTYDRADISVVGPRYLSGRFNAVDMTFPVKYVQQYYPH